MTKLFYMEYTVFKEVLEINTIREKRLAKKWSQTYLAQLSGVPQPTISQIENGTRQYPTFENMKKIAEALDLRLEDIFLPGQKDMN
ncbi:helix-turn-helix transcriptional regulator [Priestia megaterium]|uniref:helix-turn-helix transcriptional regulator n=1 Tax=Priestia megaterium TaxID=1404 RepID=UPI0021F49F5D|nr:helix-turn-helix transcriptional regulator [Priestia megaterium]UYP07373.1 helix-turn-helix transcriptional regulator [Priestia megaterium]